MEALNIELKNLQEMHLAAVQSIGVQNIENAYQKLISWASSKGLFPSEQVKMITVYHDSFKTTPHDKVRIHAGMLVNQSIEKENMVFAETLPSGKYIVGSYILSHEDFGQAWGALFQWMNNNGYQFRNTPPFEIYHNNYMEHPEKKSIVDFYIPVI